MVAQSCSPRLKCVSMPTWCSSVKVMLTRNRFRWLGGIKATPPYSQRVLTKSTVATTRNYLEQLEGQSYVVLVMLGLSLCTGVCAPCGCIRCVTVRHSAPLRSSLVRHLPVSYPLRIVSVQLSLYKEPILSFRS